MDIYSTNWFLYFRSFREKFTPKTVWGYWKAGDVIFPNSSSRSLKRSKWNAKTIEIILIFRNNAVFHSRRNKVKVTGVSWFWKQKSKEILLPRVRVGFNYQLSWRYFDWLRLYAIVLRDVLIGQKNTIFSMRNWRCFANFLSKVNELEGASWEKPVENLVV